MKLIDTLPVASPLSGASYSAAELSDDDGTLYLLEQRLLPVDERYVAIDRWQDAAVAIRDMVVRGAPAIGVAAGYGLSLAARGDAPFDAWFEAMRVAGEGIASARPTAVNLRWAVDRVLGRSKQLADHGPVERARAIADEARRIHREDVAACQRMGQLGAELLPDHEVVLTHCNAGALATGGFGTALGVIRAAHRAGKVRRVLADETRPYLQGARLTAWELSRDGIDVEVITDGMVGHFMARDEVGAVIVGADRIARSGDVANKIGTYGVAVLARAHNVPFYVAAPMSTVDLSCESGARIPIEERSSDEVTTFAGKQLAPSSVRARHPAFDVTPARLVSALVTERGVAAPLGEQTLSALASARREVS